MEEQTPLERYTGSLPSQITSTLLAATAAGPLSLVVPLLPVLVNSLATKRHAKRIESAIFSIEKDLESCQEKLKAISDAQYKFINESVATILQTTDDEKIKTLKCAIKNSIEIDLKQDEALVASRILRDISVGELKLLIRINGRPLVFHEEPPEGCIAINRFSKDGIDAHGLITFGLLVKEMPDGLWDDYGKYIETPLAQCIISLLTEP